MEREIHLDIRNERKSTIYKIPQNISEKFLYSDYAPRKVSFGPYYHEDTTYQLTEDIKEQVVLHSLRRSNKTENDYKRALSEVVQDLIGAYNELDRFGQEDTETSFLKLMIYDGCFLVDILRGAPYLDARNYDERHSIWNSPVWQINGKSPRELMEDYGHDMLLLENQIPMLVLEKLLSVQSNLSIQEAQKRLQEWVLKLVCPRVNISREPTYLHILDLYRHSLVSEEIISAPTFGGLLGEVFCCCIHCPCIMMHSLCEAHYLIKHIQNFFSRLATVFEFSIPSATDLQEGAGIAVTRSKTKSLMDVSFRHRDLRLPQISVNDTTKSGLLNIIAFEKLHEDAGDEVTSYVYFMSSLLHDANDVSLLKSRGVIHSSLQNDKVAELFNSLTKVRDPHFHFVYEYQIVGRKLTETFYKNKEWKRDLWQNYLRSPWAIVSLIAAFLLLALTAIQTIYSVLGYYKPTNNVYSSWDLYV